MGAHHAASAATMAAQPQWHGTVKWAGGVQLAAALEQLRDSPSGQLTHLNVKVHHFLGVEVVQAVGHLSQHLQEHSTQGSSRAVL